MELTVKATEILTRIDKLEAEAVANQHYCRGARDGVKALVDAMTTQEGVPADGQPTEAPKAEAQSSASETKQ